MVEVVEVEEASRRTNTHIFSPPSFRSCSHLFRERTCSSSSSSIKERVRLVGRDVPAAMKTYTDAQIYLKHTRKGVHVYTHTLHVHHKTVAQQNSSSTKSTKKIKSINKKVQKSKETNK